MEPGPGPGKLMEECHGLKSENRKIRDQLKLQVQERKLLLKKIRYITVYIIYMP